MSATRLTKLKVGITTFFALTILVLGVLWVKNYNPTVRKLRLTVLFEDGRGITGGDPVQTSGVKIGEVTSVGLNEDAKAIVRCYIDYIRLSPNTRFVIEDVGLMGDKALSIYPGDGPGEVNPDGVLIGSVAPNMSDVMTTAGELVEKLNVIAARFENDFDIAELSAEFSTTMQKFGAAVDMYRQIAEENNRPIADAITALGETTNNLNEFIDTSENKLAVAVESFRGTSDQVSRFIEQSESFAVIADTLAARMQNGSGTLGRLVTSDELYREIRQTNASIDSFVTDFTNNPEKYTKGMKFRISLF